MAVIWQKNQDGVRYQVRKAGKTLRLYTNGVCHSEFNPSKVVTGSIWDLLILPSFFYPSTTIKNVLMLGVGGGASILQLQQLLALVNITGVELNPVHLQIAARFFKLDEQSVILEQADARQWLRDYSGSPFDMIIDDLFIDEKTEPVRALVADTAWFRLILKHLSSDGLLVINFGSIEEFRHCACFSNHEIGRHFQTALKLTSPLLENVVGVFTRTQVSSTMLRKNLLSHPLLGPALQSKKLRYQIRAVAISP